MLNVYEIASSSRRGDNELYIIAAETATEALEYALKIAYDNDAYIDFDTEIELLSNVYSTYTKTSLISPSQL